MMFLYNLPGCLELVNAVQLTAAQHAAVTTSVPQDTITW
jgi:hypothetical protein